MIRSLIVFVVLATILACSGSSLLASQTLTIALESPSLGDSPKADASSPQPAASPAVKAPESDTVRVGKVGVVQISTATIHKTKSSRSPKYSTVKAETPLAIMRDEGDWYGVMMVNGTIGWIVKSSVKLTGYDLVSKKSDLSRGSLTSRGGDGNHSGAIAEELVRAALKYTESNTRYVYGGANLATGMDCSAYVRMVFGQYNVNLPRTAREQAQVGAAVPLEQLQPGDRLYFTCKNSYIDHCGIYVGNGYFVHCSSSRNGIAVDSLASDFYWRSLTTVRRSWS